MPNLTPKQEAFVMAYAETGNASEAYRRSYNAENMKAATINRSATELMANPTITARVAELQSEHKERHNITVDSLTTNAGKVFAGAMDAQQYGAARGALDLQAKLHGLITNKADINLKMDEVRANEILASVGLLNDE